MQARPVSAISMEASEIESAIMEPPALQGVKAPTETVATLTPTKFTFELESELRMFRT